MSEQTLPPSPLAPAVSPLEEADPNSLNDLISSRIDAIFNKPPREITDDDLSAMVNYYRKERFRFMAESQAKEAAGPKPRRKPVPTSVADALASNADLL